VGVATDAEYVHREHGTLASPVVWIDDWEVEAGSTCYTLRFVQAVTPIDDRTSRLAWHVSCNFRLSETALTHSLTALFPDGYYAPVAAACQRVQTSIHRDGPQTST
jgi:hypothetical protein